MIKKLIIPAVILSAAVAMIGCSKVRKSSDAGDTGCAASECHQSTLLKEVYPSNDARHVIHVEKKGYECTVCHNSYDNVALHKNGTKDSSSNNKLIIFFNKDQNPNGSFNISTKTCQNMECHGSIAWDAPASDTCTAICHYSGNGSASPDPMTGTGHQAHVTDGGKLCTDCHYDYTETSTHADGTVDPGSTSVVFNPSTNPGGSYTPGTQGGTCAATTCHGNGKPGFNSNTTPEFNSNTGVSCSSNPCHGSAGNANGNPADSTNGDSNHTTHLNMLIAAGYADESAACSACHGSSTSGSSTHANGEINITFNYPQGGSLGTATGGSFDPSTGQYNDIICSDTYCHGNFTGGNNAAIAWSGTAACGSCHPANGTNPTTVKHTKHLVQYPNQCGYCHSGYTNASAPADHVNFTKNVAFGYSHPANTNGLPSYDSASKTCTNVYCHGNFPRVTYNGTANTNPGNAFSPTWQDSSTSPCGSCHGSPTSNYSSKTHGKHTSASATYFSRTDSIESCDACHNYGTDTNTGFTTASTQGSYGTADHADFSIDNNGINADVNFKSADTDLASKTGANANRTTWTGSTQSCTNSWCHGNFSSGTLTGNNALADWLDNTTAECGDCHIATPGTSGAHATHTSAPYSYSCDRCHSGGFSGHINGTIGAEDVSVGFDSLNPNGSYNTGTLQCSNLYCHGNSTGGNDWGAFYGSGTARNNNPIWTTAAGGGPGSVNCGDCHDATAATVTTGAHVKHISGSGNYTYSCAKCHDETVQSDNTTLKAGHADGILTVVPDTWNPSGVYASSGMTCTSFYCHGNFTGGTTGNVGDWDNTTGGACGNCHDLAPQNSNYGSHDKHTDSTAGTGYGFDCSRCHNGEALGTESGGVSLVSIANHANNQRDISFDGNANQGPGTAAYNTSTNECTNTYCHGDFSGGLNATANWNTRTGGACGDCHDNAPTNAAYGSHDKHTDSTQGNYNYNCNLCHNGIADGTEGSVSFNSTYRTYHVDFAPTVRFSGKADQGPGTVASYDTGTQQCSYTYCHGDFQSSTDDIWPEGNKSNTPNWLTASTGDCGTCHGTTSGNNAGKGIPSTNTEWHGSKEAHVKHAGDANNTVNGYGYPCGFCHNGVYDATLSIGDGYGASGSGYETGTKTPNTSQHADGVRTPLSFYTAFTNTVNFNDTSGLQEVTCNSLYCHSDGWSTERTQIDTTSDSTHTDASITWNETTTCTSCHRSGSTSTNYAPDHPGYTGNGRHYGKSSHRSNCYNCHYSVVTTSTNTVIDYAGNRHVNKWHNIDLRNSGSYSGTSSRTCNPSCHGSETWRNSTDYLIRNYVFE